MYAEYIILDVGHKLVIARRGNAIADAPPVYKQICVCYSAASADRVHAALTGRTQHQALREQRAVGAKQMQKPKPPQQYEFPREEVLG